MNTYTIQYKYVILLYTVNGHILVLKQVRNLTLQLTVHGPSGPHTAYYYSYIKCV